MTRNDGGSSILCVVGNGGTLLAWNSYLTDEVGWTDERLTEVKVADIVVEDDRRALRDTVASILSGASGGAIGTQSVVADVEMLNDGGDVHEFEFTVGRLMSSDGERAYVVGCMRSGAEADGRQDDVEVLYRMCEIISDLTVPAEEKMEEVFEVGLDRTGADAALVTREDADGVEYAAGSEDAVTDGSSVPFPADEVIESLDTGTTVTVRPESGSGDVLGSFVCAKVDGDRGDRLLCFADEEVRDFSEFEERLVGLTANWLSHELRGTRHRAAQPIETVEDFATIISHDLRGHLNVLSAYVETAERTGDVDDLNICHDAIDRMDDLIGDLLSLARNASVNESDDVVLAEACSEAWRGVDSDDADLELRSDATVVADEVSLTQLLENLFRNSVEHAGDAVTVTVSDVTNGETTVGFRVEDDGRGIAADNRDEVFEAGYTSGEGSGLGLYIVRRIADSHGWRVRLDKSENGGACFEITGVETA